MGDTIGVTGSELLNLCFKLSGSNFRSGLGLLLVLFSDFSVRIFLVLFFLLPFLFFLVFLDLTISSFILCVSFGGDGTTGGCFTTGGAGRAAAFVGTGTGSAGSTCTPDTFVCRG